MILKPRDLELNEIACLFLFLNQGIKERQQNRLLYQSTEEERYLFASSFLQPE